MDRARRSLVRSLRAAGKPGKHFDLQHYLGSPLPALGVYTPDMKSIVRAFRREHPRLRWEDLAVLADGLWNGTLFEERVLACDLLVAYRASWSPRTWALANRWVDDAEGWGLCDTLGGAVIGRLLEHDPTRFPELVGWTDSPDPWRRRATLYAMGPWVRTGDLDRPFEVIDRLHRDPEFWVRRAVGTWLRECWKKDQARTQRYLVEHALELPALVITVATERAPRAFRERLRSLARPPAPRRTRSRPPR